MPLDNVKNVDLARIGFGQAIAVTPIQLICAVSSILNGGNLIKPYLVKSIYDKNTNIVVKENKSVDNIIVAEQNKETELIMI